MAVERRHNFEIARKICFLLQRGPRNDLTVCIYTPWYVVWSEDVNAYDDIRLRSLDLSTSVHTVDATVSVDKLGSP
jgi:hypothetical protein